MLKQHSVTRRQFESHGFSPGRCVAEVLGPAGAGKTTFVRSLSECYSPLQGQPTLLWPHKARALGGILYELLPGYLCTCLTSTSRWFNFEELRRMSYVKAWHRLLAQSSVPAGTITILDHGPIFMLGMVQEFGPQLVKSLDFVRWSQQAIAAWSDALDVVLWLDAPDATLLQRIELREQYHLVKGTPTREACDFLKRCRLSFGRILTEIEARGRLKVLKVDTSVFNPNDVVNQFLQAIDVRCTDAKEGTNPTGSQSLEAFQKPDNLNNSRPVQA